MNIANAIRSELINKLYSTNGWRWWLIWCDLLAVVDIINQRYELNSLVQWASRKRLSGVHKYYKRLLLDREAKLLTKQIHFPALFACAEWIYSFQIALYPTPRYTSGFATKYRIRNSQRN